MDLKYFQRLNIKKLKYGLPLVGFSFENEFLDGVTAAINRPHF